jgi:hypothetical protein
MFLMKNDIDDLLVDLDSNFTNIQKKMRKLEKYTISAIYKSVGLRYTYFVFSMKIVKDDNIF